ncbi:MAG TPA: MarR family transcriptional regulator [Hyphomicrobiales bacterium]|nr:MarR family transcriptional regulator [Hyphomicrobiales bacterium]
MSKRAAVSYETTHFVRDTCLCFQAQRAARSLARRFDEVLRPLGLTNGQFSLMNAVNRPAPAPLGAIARLLSLDRTTLTAALKPLERRGLIAVAGDPRDRRSRLLALTPAGQALLAEAVPLWRRAHAALEKDLDDATALRRGLATLAETARNGSRDAGQKGDATRAGSR